MPMTPADIDALLLVRSEHEHLEFKAARESFGNDDLVDYCVAFANEGVVASSSASATRSPGRSSARRRSLLRKRPSRSFTSGCA